MAYRLIKMEDLQNAVISRLFGVFCTRFFAENNLVQSVESFSACFCEKKKLKITCPFCMAQRLTKMEDLQNAVISRLFGVFAGGLLNRTTLSIPQHHFQLLFAKKKVENNLPILHGLLTYQNVDLQNALISRVLGVFARWFFAQNNSMHSVQSFSACFCRKKKLKITCPFCMGYRLSKMEDLQNALISRLFGVFARGFLHRTTLCIPQNHFQHVFAKTKS